MANDSSSNVCLAPNNEPSDSVLKHNEACSVATNPSFSEAQRQESGIFEGSSDFSDTCFSDNDIEWHSCDEDEGTVEENNANRLWEEFQQCTFWSPPCTIKPSCYTPIDNEVVEEGISLEKSSRCKTVTFKPDKELVTVHHIIAWDYAYRACRRGPWEQMAIDRSRFAERIKEVANVLEPCLNKLMNRISSSN